MMSLQRICFTGLKKQTSKMCILKYFGALSARPGLFRGDKIESNLRSFTLFSHLSSCNHSTSSKPIYSQSHVGSISQFHLPLSYRNYSTAANVSEKNGHLVYRGRVHNMFRGLKIFSLSTSALGIALQPYLWYSLQDMSLVATVPLFTVVNLFVFTNPFLIHFLAKRYVNELYFNPSTKEFTATVLTFFARKKTFTFTAADVKVPDMPGMFSMLTVNGRPLFVDERDFTRIEIYKHMMGFDRPLDLRHVSNPSRQDNPID